MDTDKLVLGLIGLGGIMIGVGLGFDNPTPAIIGFVLLIIAVRTKAHMS